jgi:Leucine-rich repeat (LRR) protein
MNKCLVTKLSGTVNNSSIRKLGEMRVHISSIDTPSATSQKLKLGVSKDVELEIVGNGYFTDAGLSANKGKTMTALAALNPFAEVYFSNGDYDISIKNKYAINYMDAPSPVSLNIDELSYSKDLTQLTLASKKVTGDISAVKDLTALTQISLQNSQVTGDISAVKDLTALTQILVQGTKISGNISGLGKLNKLLYCYIDNLKGDVSVLAKTSELIRFSTNHSSLFGDLSLAAKNLNFFGCILSDDSKFTWNTTRSSESKILALQGAVAMDNIDAMLINQANCTKDITSGSNSIFKIIALIGTRTSASDAAVQTLQSKGYTVSVTPA